MDPYWRIRTSTPVNYYNARRFAAAATAPSGKKTGKKHPGKAILAGKDVFVQKVCILFMFLDTVGAPSVYV